MSDTWSNRIVDYGEVDGAELMANPRNARVHSEQQSKALATMLDDVGFVAPVIVNRLSGFLVDGHLRAAMAIAAGRKVPVAYVELSPEEERKVLATFDPMTAMAGYDAKLLAELLDDIGIEDEGLVSLLSSLGTEPMLQMREVVGPVEEANWPTYDDLDMPNVDGGFSVKSIVLTYPGEVYDRIMQVLAGVPGTTNSEKVSALILNTGPSE